jgi:hypothetical protein
MHYIYKHGKSVSDEEQNRILTIAFALVTLLTWLSSL